MPHLARAFLWLLVALAAPGAAADSAPAALYQGQAIVTGRDDSPERARGLREALAQVLVKVSGDARLLGHSRLSEVLQAAPRYARRLHYRDRLAKKKVMDEQGTRERSFLLTVDFDPPQVDAALAALGARPWTGERPRVLVLLKITDLRGHFLLGQDGPRGWGQRETLLAAAERRGLPVRLPTAPNAGQAPPTPAPGDVLLLGAMQVTPQGYWRTEWRLRRDGGEAAWRIGEATYDRAIAQGVERTLLLLAGLE